MADNVLPDIPPANSTDDDWLTAINLFTGYQLPSRGSVFTDLYGNDGIPLMKVEIHDSSATPSNAELDAINDLSWRTQNSGWRIENTDFSVPFYSGTDGAVGALPVGSRVKMRKARITLLGTDTAHNVPAGGVDMGGQFGAGSALMPKDFKGWDSTPLARYSYGGGLALEQLLNPPYTTQGWGWNGKNVDRANAVDVNTFELAASAFDRAALFFSMSRQTIQNWEDELGSEDAAWRGQAAGVFWDIVHELGVNYQNYTESLPLTLFQSKAGYDLRQAKQGFVNAVSNLHATWSTWALYLGNPLRWLHDILLEVTDSIWNNNITLVRYKYSDSYGEYGSYSDSGYQEVEYPGFTGEAGKVDGGSYGKLDDLGTWKEIGNEAIRRWQQSVKDNLVKAGKQALIDVGNAWVDVHKDLHNLTTTNIDLKSDYQADKAAAEQDKADAAAAAAQAQAAADAAAAKAQHDADAAAAKAQHDADAAAAKAAADAAAAHEKELEDKQDKQRAEDQQHQKDLENQQKQQQDQQMAAQAAYQQQQQKQQEEQQAKQEQEQQRQEAEQKQQQEEQQKQQQQQEAEQKQQYEQQRQDQKQQQDEQQKQQDQQQALAQQQYAQQQQTQSDYQRKQDDAQQKQQQQQEELQKRQEQQQQQQVAEQKQQEQLAQQQYSQLGQRYGTQQGYGTQQDLQQQQNHFQQQLENGAHGQIGSQTSLNRDGTITTDYTDGSSTTINPHTGLETTTHADGTVTTDHLAGGHQLTNPDGSHSTVNQDGTVTTRYPDGSVTTVNPHTGTATTHEPDGKTVTTPLGGGTTLPHFSSPNLPGGTGTPSYQHELYDSTPYHDGALGAPASLPGAAASASGPGTSQSGAVLPLGTRMDGTSTGGGVPAGGMPMMGGMGGMGGMGAGGGNNGGGERVREVYEDEDVVTNGGSLGRRGGTGRRGYAEEEAGMSGRRTSTSSAYGPYGMGGDNHEQTQSGDRERDAWVPEEEDIWGTDEGGAPAVIGG